MQFHFASLLIVSTQFSFFHNIYTYIMHTSFSLLFYLLKNELVMLIVFNFSFVTLTEDCIIVLVMGKSPCGKLGSTHFDTIHLFHHHEVKPQTEQCFKKNNIQ